jgi:hypothetical protein
VRGGKAAGPGSFASLAERKLGESRAGRDDLTGIDPSVVVQLVGNFTHRNILDMGPRAHVHAVRLLTILIYI